MRIVKRKGVFENLKIPTYVDFSYLQKEEEQCYLLSPAGRRIFSPCDCIGVQWMSIFMFTYPIVMPFGELTDCQGGEYLLRIR